MTDINAVDITFYHYFNAMIGTPENKKVDIYYSDDGEVFAPAGTYEIENQADATTNAGIFDEIIILDKSYKARYIKVSMTYGKTPTEWSKPVLEWFGFTELSAGAYSDYLEDINASSEAASSESVTSETTSEEVTSEVTSEMTSETSSESVSSAAESSTAAESSKTPVVSEAETEEGFPLWGWILIAVGAAAVIAGVTVAIIKKRKA